MSPSPEPARSASPPLPPEPEGRLLHHRSYDVRAYHLADDRLMLRGIVHDQKPPGIYFDDDPDPLSVHHMVVDLHLHFPSLEIVAADVTMNVTPHHECSRIEPDYQQLVGLSIARGFSRKVKDLFGGPSGCTHIGALLQAMAPVAIQSMWSMRAVTDGTPMNVDAEPDLEARRRSLAFNINTCHIWDEQGEQVVSIMNGGEVGVPVWAEQRLAELGRDVSEWGRLRG